MRRIKFNNKRKRISLNPHKHSMENSDIIYLESFFLFFKRYKTLIKPNTTY